MVCQAFLGEPKALGMSVMTRDLKMTRTSQANMAFTNGMAHTK